MQNSPVPWNQACTVRRAKPVYQFPNVFAPGFRPWPGLWFFPGPWRHSVFSAGPSEVVLSQTAWILAEGFIFLPRLSELLCRLSFLQNPPAPPPQRSCRLKSSPLMQLFSVCCLLQGLLQQTLPASLETCPPTSLNILSVPPSASLRSSSLNFRQVYCQGYFLSKTI